MQQLRLYFQRNIPTVLQHKYVSIMIINSTSIIFDMQYTYTEQGKTQFENWHDSVSLMQSL